MEKYFNEVSIGFGVIGGFFVGYLGGMDGILHALIFLVVADYITGICKGIKCKNLDSRVGFIGILRKAMIFAVVAVAVEMERVLGNSIPLREIVIMFYLANEGLSFLENVSEFLPFPDKIREIFVQMRNKNKSNDEEDDNHGN